MFHVEQARTQFLLDRKPETLTKPEVPLSLVPPPPKPRSPLDEAIKELADGDPRLARYFRKRAFDLKQSGSNEGEIIKELNQWDTTEAMA